MAVAEIAELFPPDAEEATALLGRCLAGSEIVAEEKLFEPGVAGAPRAVAAVHNDAFVGVAVTSGHFLRLIAVDPECRGVGVGASLLDAALEDIRKRGHEKAVLAAEPGNYLTPGIESTKSSQLAWLEKRGFVRVGENTNLVVDVATNPRVNFDRLDECKARGAKLGYLVSRATAKEKQGVIKLARGFGEAWTIEVERAFHGPRPGVHIATTSAGQIVALAAHDGNNRGMGWFGPAATDESHRGKGLGEALLLACLLDVGAAGHAHCNIAWIGPREFYAHTVGIASERTFVTMEKTL